MKQNGKQKQNDIISTLTFGPVNGAVSIATRSLWMKPEVRPSYFAQSSHLFLTRYARSPSYDVESIRRIKAAAALRLIDLLRRYASAMDTMRRSPTSTTAKSIGHC